MCAVLVVAVLAVAGQAHAREIQAAPGLQPQIYAPLVTIASSGSSLEPPASLPVDWLDSVNLYRSLAGVPTVTQDAVLNDNCWQHARYVAENNHLTHTQDPSRPYASPAGQTCAGAGNVWIGGGTGWEIADAFEGWMRSVGHRLWLLYPTTPTFGFGFYSAANREAAALDVLSYSNFAADTAYTGWPVRYPAANQSGVPAEAYAITLMWRYTGPAPQLSSTSLRTEAGTPIPHVANTDLPAGHKGVQILPSVALPANTVIVVEVSGSYNGAPFSYTWRFTTDGASPAAIAAFAEGSALESAPQP